MMSCGDFHADLSTEGPFFPLKTGKPFPLKKFLIIVLYRKIRKR